ncbi:hypothetical protein [uncultured Neglectibacter sp.]|uniref:hypothetical protein n=1 Tax=uncultured Neglectibacter sp. TaxID=1924108 RepID=UPI0034DE8DB6
MRAFRYVYSLTAEADEVGAEDVLAVEDVPLLALLPLQAAIVKAIARTISAAIAFFILSPPF